VHAQTLPVRIWNSLNLPVEPTIAAVSGLLIGLTTLILSIESYCGPDGDNTAGAAKGEISSPSQPRDGAVRG
jgi:ABC-type spermidine/putrescine transport system permease subunit II